MPGPLGFIVLVLGINTWHATVRGAVDGNASIRLIANKCDLRNSRRVTTAQGNTLAKEMGLKADCYNETSAKTNEGIHNLWGRTWPGYSSL